MKEILTKKFLVVFSIVGLIVVAAIVLAFATGNINYPSLSDPDGVFYQRLDEQGNVVYEITNKEIFDQIKTSDGINQLLYMTDSMLLSEYIDTVTQPEIDEKLLELTYGTSDATALAEMDADKKTEYEVSFEQSMILSGFQDNEGEYARIMIAREKFVLEKIDADGMMTPQDVISEYIDSYFEDISAIKIRFTSKKDAEAVVNKFNLVSMSGIELREYKGFYYIDEDLLDGNDEIIQAYIPLDVYYFDEDDNILNVDEEILYTKGENGIYTDGEDSFNIDPSTGNLVDPSEEVIIEGASLFDSLEEALTYQENNIEYFTVTRTDPFDDNEIILIKDSTDTLVYTMDSDSHIFDTTDTDVTYTTELVVNKLYSDIKYVNNGTVNNSDEITEAELLAKYIEMYNYVYGAYRDTLPTDASVEDLLALDDPNLQFNFDDVYADNTVLAKYMFSTLSIADGITSVVDLVQLDDSETDYYYMIYKLSEVDKADIIDAIYDYLEPLILIPTVIGGDIELPSTSYYDSTITWATSSSSTITSAGVVTTPAEDTEVNLTYTINILGHTRTKTIAVTVLADGDTVDVTIPEWTEVSYKELLNNDALYDVLYDELINDYVYGSSASSNIDETMISTRQELGFTIYDYYLQTDYQGVDSDYEINLKGDKLVLASFDKTLTSDDPVEITADQFLEFSLSKKASLYTVYASSFKEVLYSEYYLNNFGSELDVTKNKSDKMKEMYAVVTSAKQYYTYLVNLYANYGMTFGYSSFSDYAYSQYKTSTELGLLKYFITIELQPYLINDSIVDYDVVDGMVDDVQDNFDNYFSLYVSHLLIYLDFDEDGNPDNYNDYVTSLTTEEYEAFDSLLADLEDLITLSEDSFEDIVSDYTDATREDSTWGVFKQNGILILTQDLNIVDDDDVTHSLTYSGEYGVKDEFVTEYVDALVELYQDYQLDINVELDEMLSDLVVTEFGQHLILVTPGDDFEKPSSLFAEEDSANPEYSVGSENPSDAPTLEQMQLYALYRFYYEVYDLNDADIEETYGITIPKLPTAVTNALDVYFGPVLDTVYINGTVNINLSERLVEGLFVSGNTYSENTNETLMTNLGEINSVFVEAVFGEYLND